MNFTQKQVSDQNTIDSSKDNYASALEVAKKDGAVKGQAYLDEKISKTSDSKEKANLYLNKSALATSLISNNNYSESLKYAYESEKANPTAASALAIAFSEEMQKNTATAIKYYKLYLERTKKPTDGSVDGYDYYVNHVKTLEDSK